MGWEALAAIGDAASAVIAAIAIYQTVQLHKKQMLLEQRQLLLPLWDHLQQLNEINPKNPVWMDVHRAVNTLELVAVCWEGQLIDQDILRRMYGGLFVELYRNIEQCHNPPAGWSKDGPQMLDECPAVRSLYYELTFEASKANQLRPIDPMEEKR